MVNATGAVHNTIPLSLFNSGMAGKIFEEVKLCGAKVVMKDNTAECVLLSPEEYASLVDEVNDARLLALAAERLNRLDAAALLHSEDVYQAFGVSEADLDDGAENDNTK